MAKVSGIDFSALGNYREVATVRMPDGKEVDLPLIKVRDADYANVLLQRNDTISSKFLTVIGRLRTKAKLIEDLKTQAENNPDTLEDVKEEDIEAIDSAFDTIGEMQKRVNELHIESHALCDEIHAFLSPYLEGTGVIEQLKENEDIYTIYVLQYMLNGAPAENDDQKDTGSDTENPTTQPSQRN